MFMQAAGGQSLAVRLSLGVVVRLPEGTTTTGRQHALSSTISTQGSEPGDGGGGRLEVFGDRETRAPHLRRDVRLPAHVHVHGYDH